MATEQIWVCENGHVDDHHHPDGGVCLTCGGEGGRTHSRVEPDCWCGNLNSAEECRGDCAVPVEVEEIESCPNCNGSGRETNTLCSRCGGTCTPFASVELLAREYTERLRVNVGLLAENTQLKKKLREGGDAVEGSPRDVVMTRRGTGLSSSPPEASERRCPTCNTPEDGQPRYTLSELTDLLTSDEVVEAMARLQCERAHSWGLNEGWDHLYPETRRSYIRSAEADLQATIAIASIKGEPHG